MEPMGKVMTGERTKEVFLRVRDLKAKALWTGEKSDLLLKESITS